MPNSTELLWKGLYPDAIRRLRLEAPRQRGNDFQLGKATDLAVALLLSHEFDAVETYVPILISKAWQTVSTHQILFGLSRWFRGDHSQAIKHWEKALKCAYCESKGLDGALMLYFAAVRDPGVYQVSTALAHVRKSVQKLMPDFYDAYTGNYVLGNFDDREYAEKMSVWHGKYPGGWVPILQAMAKFYTGLNAFKIGRTDAFWDAMRTTAKFVGAGDLFNEFIIARLELSMRSRARKPRPSNPARVKNADDGVSKSRKGIATRRKPTT